MLDVGSLPTTMRTAVTGFSLAAVLLVPARPVVATPQADVPVVELARSVTTQPDGREDSRTRLYATPTGLSLAEPLRYQDVRGPEVEGQILAASLRTLSSLPVETLARLLGVSKVTYHKWLRGHGMHPEHAAQIDRLLAAFETISVVRPGDIRQFLERQSREGRPLDLLKRGDLDAAVGLALRQQHQERPGILLSDEARSTSDLGGWFRSVGPLGWGQAPLADHARIDELERLNPSPTYAEARPPVVPPSHDGDAPVTHIRFAS